MCIYKTEEDSKKVVQGKKCTRVERIRQAINIQRLDQRVSIFESQ